MCDLQIAVNVPCVVADTTVGSIIIEPIPEFARAQGGVGKDADRSNEIVIRSGRPWKIGRVMPAIVALTIEVRVRPHEGDQAGPRSVRQKSDRERVTRSVWPDLISAVVRAPNPGKAGESDDVAIGNGGTGIRPERVRRDDDLSWAGRGGGRPKVGLGGEKQETFSHPQGGFAGAPAARGRPGIGRVVIRLPQ